MERLVKERKSLRSAFTRLCTTIEAALEGGEHEDSYHVYLRSLSDKYERLQDVQAKILDLMLDEKTEEEYEIEFNAVEAYRERYVSLKTRLEGANSEYVPSVISNGLDAGSVRSVGARSARSSHGRSARPGSPSSSNSGHSPQRRRVKLPPLKLGNFSGEAIEWLSFWGQFKQIHEDPTMTSEDKFLYLAQSMAVGSKAKRLVDSYPNTAENYQLAVKQLKRRFAREDLLVEVYIRQLLNLVMDNLTQGRVNTDIASLYDKLESYLQALETLGKTKQQFAEFLVPMVESCLPERLLRIWQRNRESLLVEETDKTVVLNKLMAFLRSEVQGEERIALVRGNSGNKKRIEKTDKREFKKSPKEPTAAVLTVNHEKSKPIDKRESCVFCKKGHASNDCFNPRRLTLKEKRQAILDDNRCFICLRGGHRSNRCRLTISCILCQKRHYPLMCPSLKIQDNKVKEESKIEDKPEEEKTNVFSTGTARSDVILQTMVVEVGVPGNETLARCLLDTGAQRSYITTSVVRRLHLKSDKCEKISHGLFGGVVMEPMNQKIYQVDLMNLDRSFRYSIEVLEQKKICGRILLLTHTEIEELLYKENIALAHHEDAPVDIEILLGADVIGPLLTGRVKETASGLVAVHTRLGWTVMGQSTTLKRTAELTIHNLFVNDTKTVDLWELDALGIKDPIESAKLKVDHAEVRKQFLETITTTKDGRYQVELPFKANHAELPEYRAAAWRRHLAMVKRLKDSRLWDDYRAVFTMWEEQGIIEEVPQQELQAEACYLPHRPVIRPQSSTTRIRPVFDASAREKGGVSLNDCIEKRENLLEIIPELLDRFRRDAIGVIADIEKAFLQLVVHPAHRNYLRFFHPDGRVFRHCRVVFGVSASPFLLGAVLLHHFRKMGEKYPLTVSCLKKAFYVNNLVVSVKSENDLNRLRRESIELFQEAGMNLHSWESNVKDKSIPEKNVATSVLGLRWNLTKDTLLCDVSHIRISDSSPLTKRRVLSLTQKIFDPIGFTCPGLLCPKKILQESRVRGLTWDEPLPLDLQKSFDKWVREVPLLGEIELERWSRTGTECQLHVYADASKSAYGACVFARAKVDDEFKVSLVRAKSRLAPKGEIAMARAELMACVLAARLVHSVREALAPSQFQERFWSDSTTALWWIKQEGEWDIFVRNRVKEIRQLTDATKWMHIPGDYNPADLLSRGSSIRSMKESRWWDEPAWLREQENEWPVGSPIAVHEHVDNTAILVDQNGERRKNLFSSRPISNFRKYIRLIAWMLRFSSNSKLKDARELSPRLSCQELRKAETQLWIIIQQETYGEGYPTEVILDSEGVARVKLSITARDDKKGFLYPILLPGSHSIVRKLIESTHRENNHAGSSILWAVVRKHYWIVGARRAIKTVIRQCVTYKRYLKKTMNSPPIELPLTRVSDAAVFETVGVDLAGPLILKKGQKVWIVLYTCAVYRAIHLDLISALSADAFLQSLRRFVARRGRPKQIYSDNGTNFRRAAEDLLRASWQEITEHATTRGIIWKFNPPSAPWWGGWWERLVRVIKELLRKTLGRASLCFDEMNTVVCEVEAVVNSRPLSYISEDDRMVPLTPAAFIQDIQEVGLPDLDQADGNQLQRRIRYRRHIAAELRRRFRDEYLGQLRMVHKRKREPFSLKIGDAVLISDDNKKRVMWPLGRVLTLYPGRDGQVRCVELKTERGRLVRPVQRLIPLELPLHKEELPRVATKENIDEAGTKVFRTRSGRRIIPSKRLDLLDQVIHDLVFESSPEHSKEEDVGAPGASYSDN